MKFSFKSLSVFGALALSLSIAAAADTKVKVLDADNFDSFIKENPLSLVEFYAPWCGHCKSLAPEYDAASLKLAEDNIALGKVDCTEHNAICEKFKVQGFPTLFVFKDGKNYEYNGSRKSDGIISYMVRYSKPALAEITTDFEKFSKADKIVVVGAFKKDSKNYALFEEIASANRDDHSYGYVADKDLAKKHDLKAGTVTVYTSFGKPETFSGEITSENLNKFINLASVQVLGEINGETYAGYAKSGLSLGFLFYDSKDMRAELEKEFLDVATKYKSDFHFVFIDAKQYKDVATSLGLKEEWPAFSIQNQTSRVKYSFPQTDKLTPNSFEEFTKGVIDGSIKPTIKSEPIPKKNDGPVKIVVAKNFEELVLDESKDTLIEFYAPWCGHCKKLEPTYNDLGKLASKFDNLSIAKFDAIANDIPTEQSKFDVQGFPTIYFVKAKSNDVVEYKGNRELASLISFIEANSATGVKFNYKKEEAKKEEAKKDAKAEEEEEDDDDEEDEEDKDNVRDEL